MIRKIDSSMRKKNSYTYTNLIACARAIAGYLAALIAISALSLPLMIPSFARGQELAQNSAYNNEDPALPSLWAINEIKQAKAAGLVPDELAFYYRYPITRGEFTLLAMRLYEKSGKPLPLVESAGPAAESDKTENVEVTGSGSEPSDQIFSDIAAHRYEKEILQAMALGIVGGYPDRTFKPDNLITRQEMAVLLVKLLEAIDGKAVNLDKPVNPDIGKGVQPSLETTATKYAGAENYGQKSKSPEGIGAENAESENEFEFVDREEIGDWAYPYVRYCYFKDILKGTGDRIIEPLSDTSREQAIALLFRIAVKKNMVSSLSPEKIDSLKIRQNKIYGSELFARTKKAFGAGIANAVEEFEQSLDFDYMNILGDIVELRFGNSIFTLQRQPEYITITADTDRIDDPDFRNTFYRLLDASAYPNEIKEYLDEELKHISEAVNSPGGVQSDGAKSANSSSGEAQLDVAQEALQKQQKSGLLFARLFHNKDYITGSVYVYSDGTRKYTLEWTEALIDLTEAD